MAKKGNQEGVNKSEAVREILTKNPKTPVKEIVATLDQRGISISPNLVYLIKSKMKQRKRRQKRQRVLETTQKAGITNPIDLILKVRGLANQMGGIAHLKKLIDVLVE